METSQESPSLCKQSKQSWQSLHVLLLFLLSTCITFQSFSQSESYNWKNVPIGGGGFVSGIITSKTQAGLMYVRTDVGGAYRWDATNSKWIPLLDWTSEAELGYQGVESIAIDPVTPGKVYMLVGTSYFSGGNTAILRSSDYGATFSIVDVSSKFKVHGNGMGRQNGEKLVIDPNNVNILYCGSRWTGLFKSTDAGLTWNRLTGLNVTTTPNENGISFVVVDPTSASGGSSQRIFAGVSQTGTNFYRSDNGGASFSAVAGAPTALMPQRGVIAGGYLYITYGNGAGPSGHWSLPEPYDSGQIWKYNISTGAWTNVTPSGITNAFCGISVDPANANRLIVSTINMWWSQGTNANGTSYGDHFFITTNGGANWTDVVARGFQFDANGVTWMNSGTPSIHWAGSIEFDPFNTQKVWVTSGNGIFSTDNIDATTGIWKCNVAGLEETVPLNIVSVAGGPLLSAVGDYDGFRHSNITQYAPIYSPAMGTTPGLAVGSQKVLRVGNKIFYSTDLGVTWTECNFQNSNTTNNNGRFGQVAVSADGNIFLHAPDDASLQTYRSTTNGSSWTIVTGLSVDRARPIADPVNANKFYAYDPSSGKIYVSTNGGVSFTAAATLATGGSKIARPAPGREGDLWIALEDGGLSRSTNSGAAFSSIAGVTTCKSIGFGKEAAGATYPTIYIWGTVNGVLGIHRSINQGSTWVRVNDDAHEYGGPANGAFVVGDMNVYGRVYMSTSGRGLVCGETTVVPTLTVSPSTMSFTSAASSQNVSVTSNTSWTVTDNQTWITSSVASGSNNGTIGISVVANTTTASRTGTVTITGGGLTQMVSITQAAACTPTTITPYTQVNGGTWTQITTASLTAGGTVKFGPQPTTGGSWTWSGPNSFSSTAREITISNVQSAQTGNYIATYTNANGCKSTQTFTITFTSSSIVVRAHGTAGTETIDLRVNNVTVATWTLTTAYQSYTASGSGAVSVYFTNDASGRDVQIDYVTIGGTTYQAENQVTNTGVWMNSTCGGTKSEWLNCNGYISFSTAGRSTIEEVLVDNTQLSQIFASPNPVTNQVTIQLSSELKDAHLSLVNTSGAVVLKEKAMGLSHTLDMSAMPSGLYIIRAVNNANHHTIKIIKE
jgi:xyloglucan-specific exo-beta-1,4-glucanase